MAIHPTKGMTQTFHGSDKQTNSKNFSKGSGGTMTKTLGTNSEAYPLSKSFDGGPMKPMSPTFHGSDMNPLNKSFGKSK